MPREFERRTLRELSRDAVNEPAKKYEKVRKKVGDVMRGTLLPTEARTIRNEGFAQGISQGIAQGISQGISQGITQGENRLGELMTRLFADGRLEDARLAACDGAARKRLYQEYGMPEGSV